MQQTEPRYYESEREAIAFLEPIAVALMTAIGTIHDASRERAEADYWRTRYNEELHARIKHGDAMMANILTAYLHPVKETK